MKTKSRGVCALFDAIHGMSKCSYVSIVSILICSLLLVSTLLIVFVVGFGSSCDDYGDCDGFKPVCASSHTGEHQFFYSQCAMKRENCLTGANWKRDFYSHCNVYV